MADLRVFRTLKVIGVVWVLTALATGIAATWIWMTSQAAWQAHLNRAHVAGIVLYETLHQGTRPPPGVTLEALPANIETANGDGFPKFPNLPTPSRVTTMSIITGSTGTFTGTRLQFHIVSPDLQYPVAKLAAEANAHPAERVGNLAQLLASYCSDPVVFARLGQGNWQLITGPEIWSCSAAPRDLRLPATALLILAIAILISRVADTASRFSQFASALKQSSQLGGQKVFEEKGPDELREVIKTLNEYLLLERERLEKRALVLSGVSHDLGTPATRLRLRTALIDDEELRSRLEVDIDQMTRMIESVLTYTQSEMNAEEPRSISLTSLVQSIVADYEDVGQPVSFVEGPEAVFDHRQSVFGGGQRYLKLPAEDTRRVLTNARPISLRRAISNLIDNSLKYGRKAAVSVQADSEMATVLVEDEGAGVSVEDLNALTGPFLRGENANYSPGVGLGLTIVATIAQQHGGSVTFFKTSQGTLAKLMIRRN